MLSQLSSIAHSSVIALAALAVFAPAASGAPLGPVLDQPVAAGNAAKVIPVEMGGSAFTRPYLRRNWGGRNWGGNWNGGRYWNRGGGYGWRHGGYGRHGGYYRNGWNNWGGFALGLGLGIPLGYYGSGYYGGYDYDPYYYDEPVYRPRVYRPRVRRAAPYYAEPRVYRYPRAQTGSHCDNVYLRGRNFSGCFDNR